MSEVKEYDDPVKAPEVQDMIMSYRIGVIAADIAKRLGVTPAEALHQFYESKTCEALHDKNTGLYLYGNRYIAAEYIVEHKTGSQL